MRPNAALYIAGPSAAIYSLAMKPNAFSETSAKLVVPSGQIVERYLKADVVKGGSEYGINVV